MKLIEKYYPRGSKAGHFLISHSTLVARKALKVAERVREMNPDLEFIREAAMLHDIGIFLTKGSAFGCYGSQPYIAHGWLGRQLLEKEGLPTHALVCERHVGVGISAEDIRKHRLPLPERDMLPLSLEEKIVCFADKFYSKTEESLTDEEPLWKVRKLVSNFGEDKLRQFDEWLELFKE